MLPIVLMLMLASPAPDKPHVKITDVEVREAEQWLGPQMTASEQAQFHAWQERIREKYKVDGQFWIDTNRGELVPLPPIKIVPWTCKEVAVCRQ